MRGLRVLHAEWTKFRTVRGWVLGSCGAALASVLFLLAGTASTNQSSDQHAQDAAPLPVGPGGEAVNDSFYFMHKGVLYEYQVKDFPQRAPKATFVGMANQAIAAGPR